MYSRMVPPAIAPIVVTEQFTSSFDHTGFGQIQLPGDLLHRFRVEL